MTRNLWEFEVYYYKYLKSIVAIYFKGETPVSADVLNPLAKAFVPDDKVVEEYTANIKRFKPVDLKTVMSICHRRGIEL